MPDGAGVIKYEGKRGVVWRMKYRDADGRQIQETLGTARDGWTKSKAQAALRDRLVKVEKQGYRRPRGVDFSSFAKEWLPAYAATKQLKRSTVETYKGLIEQHLDPKLGTLPLARIDVNAVEGLVAGLLKEGYAPATCNRTLNVLSLVLKAAARRGLHPGGVVSVVDRPREGRRRWRILDPVETQAVERAFDELYSEADAAGVEPADAATARAWIATCRDVFLFSYGTGLRRGEILGLRWKCVRLADPAGPTLRVEQTFVRNRIDTPKSAASERTIEIGGRVAEVLFQLRARTPYSGDDEWVFCHPETGGHLDPKRYAVTLRAALAKAGIEGYVRPFHDGRHSSITNAAAAGTPPMALMARAGHADFATTKRYVDLAGETFRGEAARLEERLWGVISTNSQYKVARLENAEGAVSAP